MNYPDFNNIKIDNPPGVSPVAGDTTLLAKHIKKLKPKHALEIGTGTGFVPIYLATCGITCDASDITKQAVETAKKNARRNKVTQKFFVSDLFQSVKGQYDVIFFNPPFGNTSNKTLAKYLEIVKSFIPKKSDIAIHISYLLIARQRRILIQSFLREAKKHLHKRGSVVVFLFEKELDIAGPYKQKKLGQYKGFHLMQLFF
ncbi:MAG: methyltransferase [bacterium]|nr:methyltransferase [bacterium]